MLAVVIVSHILLEAYDTRQRKESAKDAISMISIQRVKIKH